MMLKEKERKYAKKMSAKQYNECNEDKKLVMAKLQNKECTNIYCKNYYRNCNKSEIFKVL